MGEETALSALSWTGADGAGGCRQASKTAFGRLLKRIGRISILLPKPVLHIEVEEFEPSKMISANISSVQYQQGPAAGHHDVRHFILARDVRFRHEKRGKILQTHHAEAHFLPSCRLRRLSIEIPCAILLK